MAKTRTETPKSTTTVPTRRCPMYRTIASSCSGSHLRDGPEDDLPLFAGEGPVPSRGPQDHTRVRGGLVSAYRPMGGHGSLPYDNADGRSRRGARLTATIHLSIVP